jgi:phosphodiesterase/alkaline phosphatase D-like protein
MRCFRQFAITIGALLLFAGLATAQQLQITKGPVVESTTNNSATIAWSTNTSASTVLNYGTDPNNLTQTVQAPWGGLTHRVTIQNLQPGTTYYYQVTSAQGQGTGTGAISSVQSFTTQGTPSASNTNGQNQLQITNGPVLEQVADTTATVAWSTNLPSSSVVKYGTDPNNLNQTAQEAWGQTTHRVQLTNLQPNTRYYFEVQSGQGQNTPGQVANAGPMPFTTAPQGQTVGSPQ